MASRFRFGEPKPLALKASSAFCGKEGKVRLRLPQRRLFNFATRAA
jgi:hypothetical protein